jgi:hypothetical protein
MTPIKAQRTWHSLSMKWINATPFGRGRPLRNPRRKQSSGVKKGILTNYILVEVVNAITGEVAKGYIQGSSIKKVRQWLSYHNHRAQVEQVYFSPKNTFSHFSPGELKNFPVLVKLGKYQMPYLIFASSLGPIIRGKQTVTLNLNTVDNLKYLETIADRKTKMITLFTKIKKAKKK